MREYSYNQNKYIPSEAAYYETMFHLCNGYVGIRDTLDFESENARPGIFIRNIHGYGISYVKQQLNIPNWLDFSIIVAGEKINLDTADILDFNRELSLKKGSVSTSINIRDSMGRITKLTRDHLLLQDPKNVSVLQLTVESINYSNYITIEFCVNNRYGNNYHGGFLGENVKTYHWDISDYFKSECAYTVAYHANDSDMRFVINTCIDSKQKAEVSPVREYKRYGICLHYWSQQGCKATFLRKNIFYADTDEANLSKQIQKAEKLFEDFTYERFLDYNEALWTSKWKSVDVELDGDDILVEGLINNQFELLQIDNSDLTGSNIASRGLSSEYHGGHYFFNTDLYLVPFYCFFNPKLAKSLIMFRINTLETAKQNAKDIGCKGAFWSEETGIDGKPAGPTYVYDYKKQICSHEFTGQLVKHVPSLIALSIKTYVDITGDNLFEDIKVISLIVEITRYYMCIISYNQDNDCFDVKDTIGLDEYHIHVDNNYFTVEMIRWLLDYCINLVKKYKDTHELLDISEDEFRCWNEVRSKLYKGNIKNNVIEQHLGFFDLKEYKVTEYLENGIPKISKEIREKIDRYEDIDFQVVKQCDVVMFQSMFPQLYSKECLEDNFRYYETCTLHESSLSATHAGLVAAFIGDQELTYKYMKMSSRFNLDYEPKGFYINGLHYAAFAGAWLIVIYGVLGFKLNDYGLEINPIQFRHIHNMGFIFHFRGSQIKLSYDENCIRFDLVSKSQHSIKIKFRQNVYELTSEKELVFNLI